MVNSRTVFTKYFLNVLYHRLPELGSVKLISKFDGFDLIAELGKRLV